MGDGDRVVAYGYLSEEHGAWWLTIGGGTGAKHMDGAVGCTTTVSVVSDWLTPLEKYSAGWAEVRGVLSGGSILAAHAEPRDGPHRRPARVPSRNFIGPPQVVPSAPLRCVLEGLTQGGTLITVVLEPGSPKPVLHATVTEPDAARELARTVTAEAVVFHRSLWSARDVERARTLWTLVPPDDLCSVGESHLPNHQVQVVLTVRHIGLELARALATLPRGLVALTAHIRRDPTLEL